MSDRYNKSKELYVKEEAINLYNKHHRDILDRGFYIAPSAWEVGFTCVAHEKTHIEGIANAWEDVLSKI